MVAIVTAGELINVLSAVTYAPVYQFADGTKYCVVNDAQVAFMPYLLFFSNFVNSVTEWLTEDHTSLASN